MGKSINLILILVLAGPLALAQTPCTTQVLLSQPGYWTPNAVPGSVSGIDPANLAKEKKIINSIFLPIQKKYTPKGIDILYDGAYHNASRLPAHIQAGDYYYAYFYFLQHDCPYNRATMKGKHFSSSLTIYANDFGLTFSRSFFVPEKPYDENPWTDGYVLISQAPVKTDKGWYWRDGGNGDYTTADYRYLVAFDGKVPFVHITKREFAEMQKEYFQKKIQLADRIYEEQVKSSEETYARLKKLNEKDAEKFKEQNKIQMDKERMMSKEFYEKQLPFVDKFLTSSDEKTLNESAIIDHVEGTEQFSEFVDADHINAMWVIKPNASYFNPKLPKASPQLFTVHFRIYETKERNINQLAMDDLINAIDFTSLKSLLGK